MAQITQEVLLGDDFLQQHVKECRFSEGKITFAVEEPQKAGMPVGAGVALRSSAQPKLPKKEQRTLIWTPAEEHKKTMEELKAWQEKQRRPFSRATAEEEEEERVRAEEGLVNEEERTKNDPPKKYGKRKERPQN